MSNAVFQNVLADRPVFQGDVVDSSSYRQYDHLSDSYLDLLKDPNSFAREIWHEAQRFDTLTNAYNDHALYLAASLTASEPVTFDQDTEAAFRQAELLGATADQRAKLRAIVTARITAESSAVTLSRQLIVARQALTVAQNEPITDPSDRRVWGIFGDAAMESKRQGYCSVYDQISEAVGIPTRDTLDEAGYMVPSRYDVEIEVTLVRRVTVTVDADSYDEAIRAGDEMSHRDIWDYVSDQEWSHYDISETDAKDASVVED